MPIKVSELRERELKIARLFLKYGVKSTDCNEVKTLEKCIDLAESHIAAVESDEIPERQQCNDHPNNDQTCVSCALSRSANSIIDLMLPLVVDRDRKIAESEKENEEVINQSRIVAKRYTDLQSSKERTVGEVKKMLLDCVHLGSCAFVDGCHEHDELAQAIVALYAKEK
jgi:hypothetical protein